jgi:hypothetical protein
MNTTIFMPSSRRKAGPMLEADGKPGHGDDIELGPGLRRDDGLKSH